MLRPEHRLSRRRFLTTAAALAASTLAPTDALAQTASANTLQLPLDEFPYDAIRITGPEQLSQCANVLSILMGLSEDDLLQPLRAVAGLPAPGASLGGWYAWKPDFDFHHDDVGFAPASTLGQWISALARLHAGSPNVPSSPAAPGPTPGERALRLTAALSDSITPAFFANTRFPAYTTDKLVCGLMDTRRLLDDPIAFTVLARVVDAAQPSLPGHAISRDTQWKMGADLSWMWDESYTLPENLFLIATLGAGDRYRAMAERYLDNEGIFEPLAHNQNVLSDRHAYSYVNSLCSAMQAFFVTGSAMHLAAARNGFAIVERQSFATGGWGPDELLRKPGYDDLAKSLTATHNTFEAPCCGYAHLKLTRYLLRATRDGHYGDSMERVLYNALLGVLPLQPDGRAFYYADYNQVGRRIYSVHRWPCCSGTLPQVVADYGINTYLHSPGAVWVNLYQPSELRWPQELLDATRSSASRSSSRNQPATSALTLTQTTAYPFSETILLTLTTSHSVDLALHLRIPAWAKDKAAIKINGHPTTITSAPSSFADGGPASGLDLQAVSGQNNHISLQTRSPERHSAKQTTSSGSIQLQNGFASIHRPWRGTTTIELTLPLSLRLEQLPTNGGPAHPDAVALHFGPVVLFAIREPPDAASPIDVRESALLAAIRTAPREWTVETLKGPRRFVPFTELGDQTYSTYLHLV